MNNQIKTHCECCGRELEWLFTREQFYRQSILVIKAQEYALCNSCLKAFEWSAQKIIAAIKNAPDALPGKVSAKVNINQEQRSTKGE